MLAGYLFMLLSFESLNAESWRVWNWALTTKFHWFYRSGDSLASYGFEHPYFFHPETMGRSSAKTHDLYRLVMSSETVRTITLLNEDDSLTRYVQTQFLMSIRAVQLLELKEELPGIWPDFGRFNAGRITPLTGRLSKDPSFAQELLRPFGEEPSKWLANLDERIRFIKQNFWQGSPYMWSSM